MTTMIREARRRVSYAYNVCIFLAIFPFPRPLRVYTDNSLVPQGTSLTN